MIKEILQKTSGWTQLFVLFFFFFFGQLLALAIVQGFLHIDISQGLNNLSLNEIWRAQGIAAVLSFLTPALICTSLFHNKEEDFLKTKHVSNSIVVGLAIVSIFAVQPFITLISAWNQQINLPEQYKEIEENAELLMRKLILADTSLRTLSFNLLIIALFPAICEEFFFRGFMQQTIQKMTRNNPHLAIWITAFIFSFIHFQFYGFFPRILLGALLGYAFWYSRSIWIVILIHFLNNASAILLFRQYHDDKNITELGSGATWWIGIISLFLTIGIVFGMNKFCKNTK